MKHYITITFVFIFMTILPLISFSCPTCIGCPQGTTSPYLTHDFDYEEDDSLDDRIKKNKPSSASEYPEEALHGLPPDEQ